MSEHSDDQVVPVGEKIKRLREGANLTIEQLCERTQLDPDDLRRIEDHMISPALGVLVKVCDGLGVRLGHFFDQGPRKLYSLFRSGDEKVATRFAAKNGTDFGYEYHALGSEKRNRFMEPFLITIHPPSGPDSHPTELEELSTHSGEEYLYVLEGEIEVQLEEENMRLSPGDSLYYDASVPHRVVHVGDSAAKVLAVIYLPRAP